MVNPSPKLAMKPSAVLLQLFKSFHQPPSLSTRESQKLLNLLTTTFRKQLDREHGEFRKENLFPTPAVKPSTSLTRPRSSSEPIPATERHFQAILQDPLFSARNRLRPGTKLFNNPMDIFELAVSKGLMTMDKCLNCLLAERKLILRSASPTVWEGMRDSGAGLKVLRWLKASGRTQYLADSKLFGVLAEFVAAEGLQEAVWADFAKLSASLDSKSTMAAGNALLHMVQAEIKGPNALDAGISALLRASSILQNSADSTQQLVLRPSTRMLAYHATVLSQTYAKPKPSRHADLMGIVNKTLKAKKLLIAHLYLHHPTTPKPQAALDFFKDMPKNVGKSSQGYPAKPVVGLGLDTARYLLEHERVEEARAIMDVLQSSFPHQLGIDDNQRLRHAKSEAWNLELLQGLSFT